MVRVSGRVGIWVVRIKDDPSRLARGGGGGVVTRVWGGGGSFGLFFFMAGILGLVVKRGRGEHRVSTRGDKSSSWEIGDAKGSPRVQYLLGG